MAILPILTVPHPLLTQKARPVRRDEFGEALHKRLTDMAETMYAAPGVGLAGPQVGDLRRILVADLAEEDEDGSRERARNLYHVVNPEILERSKELITWEEGCLSVPEFWEDFTRPRRVRVRFFDAFGEPREEWFEGYPAVILQHEMDHLEGVVILDKVSRLKRSRYLKKARKTRKPDSDGAAATA
ncbi:MAG: peptide deformylase [Alphaproteobacteria bacterium]|nr:peptide deformylase [Alphaproteobacteria bacterium]